MLLVNGSDCLCGIAPLLAVLCPQAAVEVVVVGNGTSKALIGEHCAMAGRSSMKYG